MNDISVVLIAKNEAHIIGKTLSALLPISSDIIVVDSGSTDGTQKIVSDLQVRLIETPWEGYGPTKNKGIAAAKYDWILSVDCDEIPDNTLIKALQQVDLNNNDVVYNIAFKTFLGAKLIRHGEWGRDAHIRLFNRQKVKWNEAKVHEQLTLSGVTTVKTTKGYLLHYTMRDVGDYALKMTNYALMNADHYYRQGKKAGWLKRRVSPAFSFLQNYIFKLGFLDGREGYIIARMTAYYTMLKYERLYELTHTSMV